MRLNPPQSRLMLELLVHYQRQQAQQQERGSAMMIVSIVTILMFSLLGAALVITDLSRKRTMAFADNSSSFHSAESGLNRRAEKLRRQFLGFAQPAGTAPSGISNCINSTGVSGSGDFGCESDTFNSTQPGVIQQGNNIISSNTSQPYLAYTYVQPNPQNLGNFPLLGQIPSGQNFAGLNALEYRYRIFSAAIRRVNGADLNSRRDAQTVLQMDFNSRVIPLFQFAAFYHNDMEINNGPEMTLNGWVHTNGNLRLAPDSDLNFVGPVTAGEDIYDSLGSLDSSVGGWVKFIDSSGNPVNDAGGNPLQLKGSLNNFDPPLNASQLLPFGNLLRPKVSQLQVPGASFMTKVDASQPGGIGEYYGKADLQLEFLPTQAVPFKLTAIKTGMTAGGCSGVVTSSDRQGSPFQCSVLTEGQLRSLQQPVLVQTETGTPQASVFCPNLTTAQAAAPTVDSTRRSQVVRALAAAIAAQPTPLPYASMTSNLSSLTALETSFGNNLNATGVTPTEKTALVASTPARVAAVNAACLIPAPIQAIQNSFYDQRETRMINLLQVNLRSLTAWNYYNISVDWTSGAVTNTYSGQGTNTDELLFQRDVVDTTAPTGSLRGLVAGSKSFGATDRSEGGLLLHATIDRTVYTYPAGQSPYGFAVSQGSTLPAPLTMATDQAIYLQGDYNNIGKQSAAVMGDTIMVLSNACWDDTLGVKGPTTNECGRATAGSRGNATNTTINAAFLARTDVSNPTVTPAKYSGGLHNMMRFLESWNGINFNYTGSLVSIGSPAEFSGAFNTSYYRPPIRNWSYDASFNQFNLLPPLSPRVIYLQQQVFGRKY
jgi:hypothetical protein